MTLGAVWFGMALLCWEMGLWYKRTGLKRLRSYPVDAVGSLLPFVLSWCLGAVMVMCVGGAVGLLTDFVLWGAGWLGDGALVWGVGADRQQAPQGVAAPLTQGGLFVAGLLVVIGIALVRKGSTMRGLFSGICMGLSAGVASFVAVPLASAVNVLGAWNTGLIT